MATTRSLIKCWSSFVPNLLMSQMYMACSLWQGNIVLLKITPINKKGVANQPRVANFWLLAKLLSRAKVSSLGINYFRVCKCTHLFFALFLGLLNKLLTAWLRQLSNWTGTVCIPLTVKSISQIAQIDNGSNYFPWKGK